MIHIYGTHSSSCKPILRQQTKYKTKTFSQNWTGTLPETTPKLCKTSTKVSQNLSNSEHRHLVWWKAHEGRRTLSCPHWQPARTKQHLAHSARVRPVRVGHHITCHKFIYLVCSATSNASGIHISTQRRPQAKALNAATNSAWRIQKNAAQCWNGNAEQQQRTGSADRKSVV